MRSRPHLTVPRTWDWLKRLVTGVRGSTTPRRALIDVPILIGADGPKGLAVAAELSDGVFSAGMPQPDAPGVPQWRALLSFGTVLDDGETLSSPRAIDAAAPSAVVLYHAMYERGGCAAVDALPGGKRWREAVEAYPSGERHLVIRHGHAMKPNAIDERFLTEFLK